jgi:hypothetical protein
MRLAPGKAKNAPRNQERAPEMGLLLVPVFGGGIRGICSRVRISPATSQLAVAMHQGHAALARSTSSVKAGAEAGSGMPLVQG